MQVVHISVVTSSVVTFPLVIRCNKYQPTLKCYCFVTFVELARFSDFSLAIFLAHSFLPLKIWLWAHIEAIIWHYDPYRYQRLCVASYASHPYPLPVPPPHSTTVPTAASPNLLLWLWYLWSIMIHSKPSIIDTWHVRAIFYRGSGSSEPWVDWVQPLFLLPTPQISSKNHV